MSVLLVGASAPLQHGIEIDETGINTKSFSCRYFPEFRDKLKNFQGQTRAFATPDKFSREVSIEGEVTGTTGLMAAALIFNVATTLGNDIATFTAVAGGMYIEEITEGQTNEGWRTASFKFSSDPLVT